MYRNILKGYAIYGVGLKEGKGRARDITMQGEVIAHTGPASARRLFDLSKASDNFAQRRFLWDERLPLRGSCYHLGIREILIVGFELYPRAILILFTGVPIFQGPKISYDAAIDLSLPPYYF